MLQALPFALCSHSPGRWLSCVEMPHTPLLCSGPDSSFPSRGTPTGSNEELSWVAALALLTTLADDKTETP